MTDVLTIADLDRLRERAKSFPRTPVAINGQYFVFVPREAIVYMAVSNWQDTFVWRAEWRRLPRKLKKALTYWPGRKRRARIVDAWWRKVRAHAAKREDTP
jgi:hypothetical protein